MEKNLLSIIVVCFNERKRIEKTLVSILEQSCKYIECIVVDGGSQDGTLKVIKNYQEKFALAGIRMKIISEKDQGIYDAMNKGVRNAEGKWIYFLNAGDNFHAANVVQKTLSCIEEADDIIIGKIIFYDGYLGRVVEHSPIEKLKEDMIFCHQAVIAKKELLEKHCFDISYKYCADYEWLLAMYLEKRQIHCIDIIIADYDADGVSNNCAEQSRKEMAQIQEKYNIKKDTDSISNVNLKYKLYKKIGQHKRLARCFYYFYGKNKGYYFNRE